MALVGLVGLALTTGCDSTPRLETVPVSGVVTLDGEPVEGATVTFRPVNPEQGIAASGKTDKDGVYKLTAVGAGADVKVTPGSGTVPGQYQVTVTKNVVPDRPEDYEEWASQSSAQGDPAAVAAQQITYVVPRKYNRPQTSGLQVTVKDGENDIPLELTSE